MKTIIELSSIGFLSILLTLLSTPVIRKIAVKINLVDKPNHRKVHYEPTPLIGGISIAFTFLLSLFLFITNEFSLNYLVIFGAAYILLVVGIVDDKNDLSAKYKLAIQLLLSFFIAFNGIRITSFYGLFGFGEIEVWLQYLLTIVVITGVVNAFNLMDGVDGLVGGLSLLGFVMLLVAGILYNDILLSKLAVVFIGATIAFLKFNFSKNKIFMGDSGSLFLGFILVTLGIRFMEKQAVDKDQNYFYLFLLLVAFFAIPVLDSIRVYLGRIKDGYSPFKADKSHLHHLLLQVGLTHKKIALFITLFAVLLSFVGFGLIAFVPVTLSIMAIMVVFWIMIKMLLLVNNLFKWQKMIKILETN